MLKKKSFSGVIDVLETEIEVSDNSITKKEINIVTVDREEVVIGSLDDSFSQASGCVISTTEELAGIQLGEKELTSCYNSPSLRGNEEFTLNRISYHLTYSAEVASLSNPGRTADPDLSHQNSDSGNLISENVTSKNSCSSEFEISDDNGARNVRLEASSSGFVDERADDGSNPSFLEELHGMPCHQIPVGEPSFTFYPYPDPYLWTPMEIAAASGDPERMTIEHTLNLRSAYTEVEVGFYLVSI